MLDDVSADVVIGFGGYVAVPAYLAAPAARRRVPVVIHEANARAGIANKVGARGATRVLAAVPDSGLPNAEVVGMPVRATITNLDRSALRAEARAHFGFAADAPVLLVFGGSQGAQSLNRAVSAAAARLAGSRSRGAARARTQERPGPARTRRRASRPTSRCRTWTGWIWLTPRPIWRSAAPGP